MIEQKQHIAFDDLQRSFEVYSDRIALIDKNGEAYTYAKFEKHIAGAYQKLQECGVQKGSKVLVAVPMSLQLYAVLEALFALGATAIFLDPWMKGKKMSSVIRQVKPDLFVVTKKLSRITWLLSATWPLKKWRIKTIIPSSQKYDIATVSDNDNALITFTSGTSGRPKGANRTFAFLHAQAETLKAHLGENKEVSIDYTNFPIVGLANFALGNTVVVPQINLMKIHQANPSIVVEQIKREKVTRLVVSPALLGIILKKLPEHGTLKSVMTGGAPISTQLIQKSLQLFPEVYFEAIYGSTEAEPICITNFKTISKTFETPLKGVYVGKPVSEIRLKIIEPLLGNIATDDFNQVQLNSDEIGEIVVTGSHVNKNYYKNPTAFAANKIVDANGEIWHRTGDVGYFFDENLYLVGRDHRIMSKNKQLIYPYPIELFIQTEFGLNDVGFVQDNNGKFLLYYHTTKQTNETAILDAIKAIGYPIDKIIFWNEPLPRDARHKSKLQIETLI